MEGVGAGFSDDADLAAVAGAVFGRVIVGVHPKLLHVFQAGLEVEWRSGFAAQVARVRVNDGASFDTVVADRVLFGGLAAETDVLKIAGAGVSGAGGLQFE